MKKLVFLITFLFSITVSAQEYEVIDGDGTLSDNLSRIITKEDDSDFKEASEGAKWYIQQRDSNNVKTIEFWIMSNNEKQYYNKWDNEGIEIIRSLSNDGVHYNYVITDEKYIYTTLIHLFVEDYQAKICTVKLEE